jgi:hypothetical protein
MIADQAASPPANIPRLAKHARAILLTTFYNILTLIFILLKHTSSAENQDRN